LVRAALQLGEVGVVSLPGLRSTTRTRPTHLRGFRDAFGEALKVVALGIASSSAGDTAIKVLAKLGLEITVSVTAALLGIIVSA
jgi:hypothetical protein